MADHEREPAKGNERGRARSAPKFDLHTQLFQMCSVTDDVKEPLSKRSAATANSANEWSPARVVHQGPQFNARGTTSCGAGRRTTVSASTLHGVSSKSYWHMARTPGLQQALG